MLNYSLTRLSDVKAHAWHTFEPVDGQKWGPWLYKEDINVLEFTAEDHGYDYQVDLDRCKGREVWDWLNQLHDKTWITAEDLGWLFRALHDTVGVPRK